MEDVLEVYTRPFDPQRPLICFDESSRQLMDDLREPLPVAPGRPARYDCDFKAGPKLNLFMIFAPLLGWRRVDVTDRRCAGDWAEAIRRLVEEDFADADKIVLVMDNLNIHCGGSLYGRFEPDRARRLWEKLEIHHTPRHGSWLNAAEIELSVLRRQCLSGRIAEKSRMIHVTKAWCDHRNGASTMMDWRFNTEDARIKLKRLYPTILV